MRLLLANAGARRGALLREVGNGIQVEALVRPSGDELVFPERLRLESCPEVSHQIACHVCRTGETVALDDARGDDRFRTDPHLQRATPLSVICQPLLYCSRRVGILYLENDHASGAFSGDRLEQVAAVSSYAAILIENIRLCRALEESNAALPAAIDALPSNLAILDPCGTIVTVNSAWRLFADHNGFSGHEYGVGANYLELCARAAPDCPEAGEAAAGIRSVAEGLRDSFFLEYACHSPAEKRWFQMSVTRFRDCDGERLLVVHLPITEIKLTLEELERALEEIARLKDHLQAENLYLQEELRESINFNEIVGSSPALRATLRRIEQVAPTDATVLILGETGTGKELVARAIHGRSRRREHTMVRVNCAALPAALIESELFGHEKGAFTGALAQRSGRFELADKGTIFLDEIGDLPLELQAKLLRAIQEGEFERLGSSRTIKVDVRVIAATNRDLEQAVAEGKFRADLYYRLKVFPIVLAPLRQRPQDIPLLVWYFIRKKQSRLGRNIKTVGAGVMKSLTSYAWPGNVRELENVVEHALIVSSGPALTLDQQLGGSAPAACAADGNQSLDEAERSHIVKILQACSWKVKGKGNAAERLGVHPNTLRYRIKKLGIKPPAA